MNNEQNNNEKKIVTPELVDLNKVTVNNDDTMLNRERSNIVSASIQANDAIDEKKALNVNNELKSNKVHPLKRIIAVIFAILVALVCIFFLMKLVNKIMNYDNKETNNETTTTTALKGKSLIKNYSETVSKVRKFQSDDHILILSPSINNSAPIYLMLTLSPLGLTSEDYGDYTLTDNGVLINGETYSYVENGLLLDNEEFEMKDEEVKTYQFVSDDKVCFLIVNGSVRNEYAMYIEYTSEGAIVLTSSYTETLDSITFKTGEVFTKDDMTVSYNGNTMEYVY